MKIPLENLLTQLMFLSSKHCSMEHIVIMLCCQGGKDKSGRVLLSINCTVKKSGDAQILHTFEQSDLIDMLTYFVSLPRCTRVCV